MDMLLNKKLNKIDEKLYNLMDMLLNKKTK